MSKGFRDLETWAKNYIERYDDLVKRNGTSGNIVVGGYAIELYNLAKAIIADLESREGEIDG